MDLLLGSTFWGEGPANSDVQCTALLLPRSVSPPGLFCLMALFHRLQFLSSAKVLAWLGLAEWSCPPSRVRRGGRKDLCTDPDLRVPLSETMIQEV